MLDIILLKIDNGLEELLETWVSSEKYPMKIIEIINKYCNEIYIIIY